MGTTENTGHPQITIDNPSGHRMKKSPYLAALCLIASMALASNVWALQISSLSPQGEVTQVRQVVAKFDQAAVDFGDTKAAAPLTISCSDAQASKGNGRWISEREWAYEFENDLPPGVRCSSKSNPGFAPPAGKTLTGTTAFAFNTGGPFVRRISPSTNSRIDEEQFFVLELNGAAAPATFKDNLWCTIEGVGEKVDVKMIDGNARAELLKATGYEKKAKDHPERFITLVCNRRFNPSGSVSVVYGKGIATPSGVANSVEKRFNYKVREPFAASFTCERENAQSPCLPIRPMSLRFNAPITKMQAQGISIKSAKESFKAELDENDGDDSTVNSIRFKGPFTEETDYRITPLLSRWLPKLADNRRWPNLQPAALA
jgi:alpha-2-macroglobulin